uniref:G_PROTEIN_RECEP_F1_2 domain-containing protein n=1 Tax=Panagrellus redivivus TaxID=6233 RepID=A0A7E4ZRJ1_PANRE
MNKFLFHHETYESEYNCSFYDVNQISLADRQHPIIGVIFVVTATIMILLYLPCILVFCRGRYRKQPCYKLMIFLGIIDVIITFCNGVLTGFFIIFGVVYCEYPMFTYIIGSFGVSLWCAQSASLDFLALNRCLEMARSHFSQLLFDKNLVYVWISMAVAYFFLVFWYSTPAMFSPFHMSWMFNPHVGYYADVESKYRNVVHMPNNIFVIVAMTSIYTVFILIFYKKSSATTNKKHVKQTFVQVFLLCLATVILCVSYIIIQFITLPTQTTMLTQFVWICYGGVVVSANFMNIQCDFFFMMQSGALDGTFVLDSALVVLLTGTAALHGANWGGKVRVFAVELFCDSEMSELVCVFANYYYQFKKFIAKNVNVIFKPCPLAFLTWLQKQENRKQFYRN